MPVQLSCTDCSLQSKLNWQFMQFMQFISFALYAP